MQRSLIENLAGTLVVDGERLELDGLWARPAGAAWLAAVSFSRQDAPPVPLGSELELELRPRDGGPTATIPCRVEAWRLDGPIEVLELDCPAPQSSLLARLASQRRSPRVPTALLGDPPVRIHLRGDSEPRDARLRDLSAGGCGVELDAEADWMRRPREAVVVELALDGFEPLRIPASMRAVRRVADGVLLGLGFVGDHAELEPARSRIRGAIARAQLAAKRAARDGEAA